MYLGQSVGKCWDDSFDKVGWIKKERGEGE